MRAKSFFYACLGILALALAYHFGASTATAQAPGNSVVTGYAGSGASGGASNWVVTANGDVYIANILEGPWVHRGNIFSGGPTPALQESFGQLKARYRGEREAVPQRAVRR